MNRISGYYRTSYPDDRPDTTTMPREDFLCYEWLLASARWHAERWRKRYLGIANPTYTYPELPW